MVLYKNGTINNKTQSISENNDEQNKKKKTTEINNNSRLSMHFEQEMIQGETKEILRHIPKTKIQKGTNNFNGGETIRVLDVMNQPQIVLDDTRKYHIEFLLRFICFEEKLNAKINSSYKLNINKETGYIINHKIIDCFKDFYQYQNLQSFLRNDNILGKTYKLYKNKFGYINSNDVHKFKDEALKNLPKDYISEIMAKDNTQLLSDLQNIDLYKPLINCAHHQQQYLYFPDCNLLDETLGKYILYLLHNQNKIIEKVQYVVLNKQIVLVHNLNIYFGNINNDKSKYVPEIMICCCNKNESDKINNELMNEKININSILQLTKRIDNNNPYIGLYNNTNSKVIVIQGNYTLNKKEEIHNQQGQGQANNINIHQQQMQGYDQLKNNNAGNGQFVRNNNQQFAGSNSNHSNPNQFKQANQMIPEMKHQIKIILNLIIDLKVIRTKRKRPLNKNSKYEKYYPINNEWISKFMDYYKLSSLYTNQIIHKTLDNIIFNTDNISILSNDDIIENAKIQKDFMDICTSFSMSILEGKYAVSIPIHPNKIIISDIFYHKNFTLVSENTMKYLKYYINRDTQPLHYYCYFGDNKIIVVHNGAPTTFLILIYYLDKSYKIVPEIFFRYYGETEFKNSIFLLQENGFLQFYQYYLMFNDNNKDFVSPILDKENKEIGYAYKYNPSVTDFSFYIPYIIDNNYKTMLKLYFNYIRLKSKTINQKQERSYLLINSEFFKKYKDYYEYPALEQLLYKNNIAQQASKNIIDNYNYALNDKMLALIIKNLPDNINQKFIEKSKNKVQTGNIPEAPKINGNLGIFYYDEFELIDNNLYSLIFKKNNIGIYGECYFVNGYLCIKMPTQINSKKSTQINIFGRIHSNHIFQADYLLEYNSYNDFKTNFNYGNQIGGFDKYIFSFQFKNNYIEELTDINNKPLGIIYNIKKALAQPQVPQPQPPYQNPGPKPKDPFQVPGKAIPIPSNQPPKIGLKNVGATCYMNATLQCLSQIYHLADYFKNNQQVNNVIVNYKYKKELCLTESFKILIDNLWPQYYNSNHQKNSNNYYYAPYDFKDKISKMNPLFEGAQANDAKDLVNYIIMTLHEELNIYPKNNNNNAIINPNLQSNQMYIFNNFMNAFFKENKSIISDIFYGIHHTTTLCKQCKILKHNFEAYFFLTFPLEEVRKFKLQNLTNRNYNIMNQMNMNQNMMMNPMMMNQMNMNQNMMMNPMNINQNINVNMVMNPMNMNNMNINMNMNINVNNNMNLQQEFNNNLNKINLLNQNTVDIYDCFEYSQNPEEFTGQNAMYCDSDNCHNQFPATFTTKLYNAPEVLIIVLNRGQGNQFKTKLKFDFQLNLMDCLEDKNSGCFYELIGLVTHMGESGGSGHFIATCKSPIDKNWYQYNDDLVFPVTNFNQQMLDYATPYILFFKKFNMGK